MDSEPELDDIDPSLICPVCLDLLHDPFSAVPCKHTFCETCLRRLGSKNAMDTSCPMCRQRILFCNIKKDLTETIKLQFPEMYEKRKQFERTNPAIYAMPLPWRPGWRNLMSGRPMGGNRFNSSSSGELFRRIVQQLPYYIPPVVLANLINLVFFIFLLFAVEVVPTLLSLLMKKRNPNLHAQLRGGKVVSPSVGGEPSAPLDSTAASGEINDYEDESHELASSLETNQETVIGDSPDTSHAFYPSPEDASPAMDTTFYYALYMVLLLGTLLGNFFLLHHPVTLIPRGSTLERWFNHPQWGRFNRRVLDVVLVIALATIPIITLPLLLPPTSASISTAGSVDKGDPWLFSGLAEYCTSFIAFPYLFVAVIIVWLVSVYFDCQQDDLD